MGEYQIIVGAVLPLVLTFIMQPKWAPTVKAIVALAACLVAAIGQVAVEGGFSASSFSASFLSIVVACQATYHGYWKHTGLPDIEDITSPPSQRKGRHAAP